MKLTKEDKELLLSWGHDAHDFAQIEEAAKSSKTKYRSNGSAISRDEAIKTLGRKKYLAGISRSAFHFTSAQVSDDERTVVYFDSSKLFGRE